MGLCIVLPPFQNRWPNFALTLYKVSAKLGHLFWNGGSTMHNPMNLNIFIKLIDFEWDEL